MKTCRCRVGASLCALTLTVTGCASTQLNYNTLDLASTVDSLVTDQVLTNLAKVLESPYAIPSQVAISTGTVTTNNSITPSFTAPLNVMTTATNTVATTFAAATSSTVTKTATSTKPNVGFTANAVDQWTQTWGVSPLTDPDQLRRLRSLYQYGAGYLTPPEFLCSYPLIEKSAGAPAPPLGTVTYPTSDGKSVTVTIGASPNPPPPTNYFVPCKNSVPCDIKRDTGVARRLSQIPPF